MRTEIWEASGKPFRKEEIWIDLPPSPKWEDLAGAIVNVGTFDNPEFLDLQSHIPIDPRATQYMLNRWRGHVFCPGPAVESVSAAAKGILSERFSLTFNRFSTSLAHVED